jgi:hypothetical protein
MSIRKLVKCHHRNVRIEERATKRSSMRALDQRRGVVDSGDDKLVHHSRLWFLYLSTMPLKTVETYNQKITRRKHLLGTLSRIGEILTARHTHNNAGRHEDLDDLGGRDLDRDSYVRLFDAYP